MVSEFSKLKKWSRQGWDVCSIQKFLLGGLVGLIAWHLFSKGFNHYENLQTNTTFVPDGIPSERYYGGCASNFCNSVFGYTAIHSEGENGLLNAFEIGHSKAGFQNSHAVERFYAASFLPGILIQVTRMDSMLAYYVVNVFLWLLSALLAYRIGVEILGGRTAGLIFALLMTSSFVFYLMFRSLKIQYSGNVFLLLGIWLYERYWRKGRVDGALCFGALSFWVIGQLSAMGWVYVLIYILIRFGHDCLSLQWRQTIRPTLWVLLMLVGGKMIGSYLLARNGLQSGLEAWKFDEQIDRTLLLIGDLIRGREVSQGYVFGVKADIFFNWTIPILLKGYFEMSIPYLLTGVWLVFVKGFRWLIVLAALLFPIGQLGILISGWGGFHYAYMSLPSVIGLMMGFALCLGRFMDSKNRLKQTGGLMIVAGTLLWANSNTLTKVNQYYGNEYSAFRDIKVIFEDHLEGTSRYQ